MLRKGLLFGLAAMLALACAQGTGETEYEVAVVMLPEGEADAGREAFLQLGCVGCHTVAWEKDLPAPTYPNPGPELGLEGTQMAVGSLATSIIAPSHRVPEKYRVEATGGKSPMPSYTETLTVRQLADIVTYLRRQGMKTQTKLGAAGQ